MLLFPKNKRKEMFPGRNTKWCYLMGDEGSVIFREIKCGENP